VRKRKETNVSGRKKSTNPSIVCSKTHIRRRAVEGNAKVANELW
jgi:hypothetical protein